MKTLRIENEKARQGLSILDESGQIVAEVFGDELAANARLFAAAPSLMAALTEITEAADAVYAAESAQPNSMWGPAPEASIEQSGRLFNARNTARAAIAKATGQAT
jgi:hypothetical protein